MPADHSVSIPTTRHGLGRLASSTAWSALDFWTQQATALVVFVVVGNMVGPAAVGVLTMAQLAVTLMLTFLLDGFGDALIQRRQLDRAHVDTAFVLLTGLGLAAGAILWLAAPLAAGLFDAPALAHILPLLAIGLPFQGAAAPYQAMLQREMRFAALALRSLIAQGSGFACALLLARAGFGAEALVGYFLTARLLDTALLMLIARRLPGRALSRAALADIVGYGKHRVGNQVVGFVVMQIDRFSTAYFLGPVAVGLYSVAERITSAFNGGLSGVLVRVAFPTFSSRQGDPALLRQALRDMLLLGNLLALPAFTGIALVSEELVASLFSPAWAGAAPVLAVLSLAGIPHATNYILTAAINALGRPDVALRYSIRIMLLRLVSSIAAAPFGLLAVAWANLGVTACSTILVVAGIRQQLPDTARLVPLALRVPALATLGMTAAVVGTGMLLDGLAPPLLLAAKIAAGGTGYAVLLLVIAPQALALLRRRAT